MKYSSIPLAQTVIAQCKENGISNIVISPGSRNAPLTISFTEDSFFSCYSIVDERCAAFFALGMAQNIGKPVAVVCTSGSALLNYYPAVAEAYYSEIPLVVISADRPSYKIDVGDGQTIRQDNVFNRHIGYNANLKQDVSHATARIMRYKPEWIVNKDVIKEQNKVQAFNELEINTAIHTAKSKLLPVHINVPFEEPLYSFNDVPCIVPKQIIISKVNEKSIALGSYAEIWKTAKQKIVLVGVNPPNSVEQSLLDSLGSDPSVLVLTETTSNLHHPNFFNSIDTLIAPIELSANKEQQFKALQPEILLTFGGLIVSKKIKAFLRQYAPNHHWHIGETKANDTFYCLDAHLKTTINTVLNAFYNNNVFVDSSYFSNWDKIRTRYLIKQKEYLEQIPFTDFSAFRTILDSIPLAYQLHLANSSTIRYAQLFEIKPSINVFCNRGTSGIDGSTSTAIGASQYEEMPTLLVTGDLSFFYDSNALWNDYIRDDFRIIVINNSGGGIFRILPGKDDSDNFQRFFETTHKLNASSLCEMYGLDYFSVNHEDTLKSVLSSFFDSSNRARLIEVETPRLLNDKILMDYFHFIS